MLPVQEPGVGDVRLVADSIAGRGHGRRLAGYAFLFLLAAVQDRAGIDDLYAKLLSISSRAGQLRNEGSVA
jgi:hypothetical protein